MNGRLWTAQRSRATEESPIESRDGKTIENIWDYLATNSAEVSGWHSYEAIVAACKHAWMFLISDLSSIDLITHRPGHGSIFESAGINTRARHPSDARTGVPDLILIETTGRGVRVKALAKGTPETTNRWPQGASLCRSVTLVGDWHQAPSSACGWLPIEQRILVTCHPGCCSVQMAACCIPATWQAAKPTTPASAPSGTVL